MNIFSRNNLYFRDCLGLDKPDRLCHLTPTVSTPKRLDTATQLTAAYVTQYTVPAATTTKLTEIIAICSTPNVKKN